MGKSRGGIYFNIIRPVFCAVREKVKDKIKKDLERYEDTFTLIDSGGFC